MNIENTIFLPGNQYELLEHYLDKKKHIELLKHYEIYNKAVNGLLTLKQSEKYGIMTMKRDEILQSYQEIQKKLFRSAMFEFAARVCREQINICEQRFWEAECGKEGDDILSAPIPIFSKI